MKLRIVSDGTYQGTLLTDEHGHAVAGVSAIEWRLQAGQMARAVVTLARVPVELDVAVDAPGVKLGPATPAGPGDAYVDGAAMGEAVAALRSGIERLLEAGESSEDAPGASEIVDFTPTDVSLLRDGSLGLSGTARKRALREEDSD